jgi:glutamine synthetase adenylyltransferase
MGELQHGAIDLKQVTSKKREQERERERKEIGNDRQRKCLLVPLLFHVMIAERSADATIRRIRPTHTHTHTHTQNDHRKDKQEMAARRVEIIP